MITTERNFIYDRLCRILNDFENNKALSIDLYDMLVEIQRKWDNVITIGCFDDEDIDEYMIGQEVEK